MIIACSENPVFDLEKNERKKSERAWEGSYGAGKIRHWSWTSSDDVLLAKQTYQRSPSWWGVWTSVCGRHNWRWSSPFGLLRTNPHWDPLRLCQSVRQLSPNNSWCFVPMWWWSSSFECCSDGCLGWCCLFHSPIMNWWSRSKQHLAFSSILACCQSDELSETGVKPHSTTGVPRCIKCECRIPLPMLYSNWWLLRWWWRWWMTNWFENLACNQSLLCIANKCVWIEPVRFLCYSIQYSRTTCAYAAVTATAPPNLWDSFLKR